MRVITEQKQSWRRSEKDMSEEDGLDETETRIEKKKGMICFFIVLGYTTTGVVQKVKFFYSFWAENLRSAVNSGTMNLGN